MLQKKREGENTQKIGKPTEYKTFLFHFPLGKNVNCFLVTTSKLGLNGEKPP